MTERFETFTVLISSISRSIRRLKTEETAEFNLKSPHVSCLYYLYRAESMAEGMTAAELCEICDEDKAAVSRSILYLEQKNLVARSGSQGGVSRRYRAPLTLTDKGREVAAALTARIDRVLEEVAVGVTEEEREILYRCLGQIDRNLMQLCEQRGDTEN